MTPADSGTRDAPWMLKTPPMSSEFEAFRDDALDPPALVVRVGKTELRYHLRCIDDLHVMLKARGDWMPLGAADEQKPAGDGTVEAWGRSPTTPSAAGTGSRRACVAASPCMSRPCSRCSGSPKSSTTRATTGCGRARSAFHNARLLAAQEHVEPHVLGHLLLLQRGATVRRAQARPAISVARIVVSM